VARNLNRVLVLVLVLGAACEAAAPAASAPAPASQAPAAGSSTSTSTPAAAPAERKFGQGVTLDGPVLDVKTVLANPEPYVGKKLKCEGTVARVCERAGCWLELQGETQAGGLRVPMAGHAFFVPQEIVGKHAVIEGELTAVGLSPEAKAHLEGEGLKAVGALSLSATGLVVR
jgi:hypothetical protein